MSIHAHAYPHMPTCTCRQVSVFRTAAASQHVATPPAGMLIDSGMWQQQPSKLQHLLTLVHALLLHGHPPAGAPGGGPAGAAAGDKCEGDAIASEAEGEGEGGGEGEGEGEGNVGAGDADSHGGGERVLILLGHSRTCYSERVLIHTRAHPVHVRTLCIYVQVSVCSSTHNGSLTSITSAASCTRLVFSASA